MLEACKSILATSVPRAEAARTVFASVCVASRSYRAVLQG